MGAFSIDQIDILASGERMVQLFVEDPLLPVLWSDIAPSWITTAPANTVISSVVTHLTCVAILTPDANDLHTVAQIWSN